ncbi:peroxiredoxin-like family protein [Ferrimonas lipolytica]|uniref:AhpC/TSA family protein n=1 Tax=Ferrimonas lipolytica TaxID=2724191 RepID=A0A6H1UHN0_9GAMM|nr:peroxiredoxin-like family protein [Ferrimonas lipolytica]QIZ77726.1 AhpC/TSA family protein [Ferrimonas lipolytica]
MSRFTFTTLILTLVGALSFSAQATLADSADKVSPLLNGMEVPAITVQNSDGKSLSLNQLMEKKPSLVLFYRGGWCPFCNAQLAGLQQIEAELEALGVQVLAIAPELPENLKEGEGKGNYQLLSDHNLEATIGFGLGFTLSGPSNIAYKAKFGDRLKLSDSGNVILPAPAAYLVDTDGLVHFSYVNPNYKVRVHPKLIVTAAELMVQP